MMKGLYSHLLAAVLVVALSTVVALGDKTKSATVSFAQDVTIGGTLVKAGDYQVKFNEETNELSVMKGSKVIAKTSGKLEARTDKARATTYQTRDSQLISIAFGGERQNVVVEPAGATTGSEY